MTASTEARGRSEEPAGLRWRDAAAQTQRAALPPGRAVVSCTAAIGVGGLGRHLGEIRAALDHDEELPVCISGDARGSAARAASRSPRHALGIPYLTRVLGASPIPVPRDVRARAFFAEFDAYAAQRLPPADHLIAFNSQALTQFRAARRARYESLALVSANPHLRRLARQHALARRRYPLERSWATHLLTRNLAEYAMADRIYYASRYIRESFLEEGFPEERLASFPLTPDPRYAPGDGSGEPAEQFEIVYVGSLTVHKGVPLLIDAVRRLPGADIRLRLVGGWATRGMRRFIQSACAGDGRISVSPGDPLPHLRRASLYVHPAYEDGFGYAPAEALACGVPVLVSEDTGMKDLIDSPRSGLILPTGDLTALTEAIEAAYRGEILARAARSPIR